MAFRDRFLTTKTAKAILSWRLLVGAGVAVGTGLVGVSWPLAVVIGAGVYAASVVAAMPRAPKKASIDPFVLSEPWRQIIQGAQSASRRLQDTIRSAGEGPLVDTLSSMAERLDAGLATAWEIAQRGDEIDEAVTRLGPTALRSRLSTLEARSAQMPDADTAAAIESVKRQIETAERLSAESADIARSLRLTQTQLDELVAKASEVTQGTVDTEAYRREVDDLVINLEGLRQAVNDTRTA